jgi:hypothetical protein
LERAGPNALSQRLRRELGIGVVLGIASVDGSVALTDNPGIQILGFGPADGHDPTIAVSVARIAIKKEEAASLRSLKLLRECSIRKAYDVEQSSLTLI